MKPSRARKNISSSLPPVSLALIFSYSVSLHPIVLKFYVTAQRLASIIQLPQYIFKANRHAVQREITVMAL
jgi:hypothetical protein